MYTYPDPRPNDPQERRVQRLYEMLPGFLTWGTFLGFIGLSFVIPMAVAIFVILYDIYWLLKVFYLNTFLIGAYRKMTRDVQKDWLEKARVCNGFENLYHAVIFPTYDEDKTVLETSLTSLKEANYPVEKMIVVVATEEREGEARQEKEDYLRERFEGVFHTLLITTHPADTPGELKAKGANTSYAARRLQEYLDEAGIDYRNVVASIFDSDTIAHQEYLPALAYTFLTIAKPHRQSYQPLPMYHNNIWEVPPFSRIMAVSSTFWHMMESMRPDRMVTFSSHSMSFQTLVNVNFWPVNMVSDDSAIYWKCIDYYNGDYEVKPIHIPVSFDAIEAETLVKTFQNQYKQMRRWAYGIENLPLTMRSYARNPQAGRWLKFERIFNMIAGHYTWATAPLILALVGWVPLLLGGDDFRGTVIAYNLPDYTGTMMTVAMVGLFLTAYLNGALVSPRPKKYSWRRGAFMYLQWILAPIVAIPLAAAPAIEAQTRLFFGKYLGFWVTPKGKKKKRGKRRKNQE
jgi:cellulose synthase/poly-beta-1,6-N-acetylglucosamine synthase-like glycosyltransferase